MKIKRQTEVAVLTAEEYAILKRAYDILDEICEDCMIDDGEGLLYYAKDAKEELGFFLDDGKDNFYDVEEAPFSTIIVKLILEE